MIDVLMLMLTSLIISIVLASPYYLFGGFKQTIDYIQVVMFGSNQGMWTPNFPLNHTLAYYLIGRGGWMMGAWFWLDIVLLGLTLLMILYRKQWDLITRAIAAILIFITAYASVTIPRTKSPFLGLLITSILLVLSYLAMIYWLEILNAWVRKRISPILGKILTLILIASVTFVQWKSFPFIGGGITLLSSEETITYNQSFERIVQVFRSLSTSLAQTDRKKIFLPASTTFLNPTNLNLKFQFENIQTLKPVEINLNHDDLDSFQTYQSYALRSAYTILVRSSSVTYPSSSKKGGNSEFGEMLYDFLETSGKFERIDRQPAPILKGELLIYHQIS